MTGARPRTVLLTLVTALVCGSALLSCRPAPVSSGAFPSVVGIGDSLTRDTSYWVDLLPADWSAQGAGQGGGLCSEIDVYAQQLIPILPALGVTDLVIFCGTNDISRGTWNSSATYTAVQSMLGAGLAAGLRVVLVAPPPRFGSSPYATEAEFHERGRDLRDHYALIAAIWGVSFADAWSTYWAQPDPRDFFTVADPVHPKPGHGRVLLANTIALAVASQPAL